MRTLLHRSYGVIGMGFGVGGDDNKIRARLHSLFKCAEARTGAQLLWQLDIRAVDQTHNLRAKPVMRQRMRAAHIAQANYQNACHHLSFLNLKPCGLANFHLAPGAAGLDGGESHGEAVQILRCAILRFSVVLNGG